MKKISLKKKTTEISEIKLKQVIWMLKVGKTKKACCEHLGIAYNTKRLDTLIQEYRDTESRTEELKQKARSKELTDSDKQDIIKSYMEGEAISSIATRLYLTSPRIKKIIVDGNVPIRGRGKNSEAKTGHIVQDLDIKFKAGDRVFIGKENCFGIILSVYDEEYLDIIRNPIMKRNVYLWAYENRIKEGKLFENESDLRKGIHYEEYYRYNPQELVDKKLIYKKGFFGEEWKTEAVQWKIDNIERVLEETGRESYDVGLETKSEIISGVQIVDIVFCHRKDLFPVKV